MKEEAGNLEQANPIGKNTAPKKQGPTHRPKTYQGKVQTDLFKVILIGCKKGGYWGGRCADPNSGNSKTFSWKSQVVGKLQSINFEKLAAQKEVFFAMPF